MKFVSRKKPCFRRKEGRPVISNLRDLGEKINPAPFVGDDLSSKIAFWDSEST
jgi:hypothetical protein